MRHERINEAGIAAAAWPSTLEGLILAEPEAPTPVDLEAETHSLPTPAVPDVAASVGRLIVAAYATLIGVFFAFFTGSALALFSVVIAAGFVTIFFVVPRIILGIEPDSSQRPSFPIFLDRGLETLTGHSTGRDALVQMLIVPVLLTLGLLAMGIVGAIYL